LRAVKPATNKHGSCVHVCQDARRATLGHLSQEVNTRQRGLHVDQHCLLHHVVPSTTTNLLLSLPAWQPERARQGQRSACQGTHGDPLKHASASTAVLRHRLVSSTTMSPPFPRTTRTHNINHQRSPTPQRWRRRIRAQRMPADGCPPPSRVPGARGRTAP
jgi:hypothetical protein